MHTVTTSLAFLQNLSPVQIILVLFIILLLFGAKRLPELGQGLGKFVREFKKTTSQIEEDIRSSIEEEPAPKAKPAAHTAPRRLESEPLEVNPSENGHKSEA